MDTKKIKIELELAPEIAFLVATHLASTAHGDLTLQKLLSDSGIDTLHEVAQMMIDQVSSKTDHDHMQMR
jgi:mannitol-specific phosphotransferase system IIBC component